MDAQSSRIRPLDLSEGNLAPLLQTITPLGAAALRCWPHGSYLSFEEIVMPITQAEGYRSVRTVGEPFDPLERLLSRVQINGQRLGDKRALPLATMLAPGPRRRAGLPAYSPAGPNVGQSANWAMVRQQLGSIGRAVWAAAALDLQGMSAVEVSRSLGLHDHELHTKDGVADGDTRRLRDFRRNGRLLLGILGAWPWAHAEHGVLPSGWRTDETFVEPLSRWRVEMAVELDAAARLTRGQWAA